MQCIDLPQLQLGARGVAIDFVFRRRNPSTGVMEDLDVSGATILECRAVFKRPGTGGIVQVPVVFVSGQPERLRYITREGFLQPAGEWQAQAFVVFPGTPSEWVPSEVVAFRVNLNLRPMSFLIVDPAGPAADAGVVEPDAVEAPVLVPDVEVST